ncbi:LexA family protein [Acinetobacter sp. 1125_18A]|uniref:LexA family protein n=1 Tax=Acinetobacter sp. 1125_18A TaxID=2605959 RepID=UPI0040596976
MKAQIGEAMRKLRKERKMTQDDLAEKLEVATANISRYETGKQGIEVDKLPALAKALDVSVSEFFQVASGENTNVSETTEVYRVPLISWVQAGNYEDVFLSNLDNIELVETTYKPRKHTYALKVVGDSMESKFPEGCVIIVEPEEQPHNKSFVIVTVQDNNQATFKQLIDDESGTYLKPLNEKYPLMPLVPSTTFCGVVKKMQMDV